MAWVDVKEDVGNIVSDAASIPGNRLAGEAEYIKAKANQIAEPAIKYEDDFVEKGQREGYGEAIWQDVVLPIAGTPTSRGAVIGAAGALGADLLDPTPGINPMNIAGGSLLGAAVGTAVPYAYDAAQALSNPNSVLRGDTWKRAGEGAKIAFMGDEQGNLDVSNIPGNIAEGVGNIYQGGLAGVDQLGSDVAGFFGADEMEARLQKDADTRRSQMGKNSAVGAMAEELSYDAGMGGVLGKGAEVIGAAGKGISRWAGSNVAQKGRDKVAELFGKVKSEYNPDFKPRAGLSGTPSKGEFFMNEANKALKDKGMFPGAQALADLAGTFSPKSKNFIEKNWDDVSAYVFGGKNASFRAYNKMLENAMNRGYSPVEAKKFVRQFKENPKKLEPLRNVLSNRTNTGAAKLLGIGTGILADVDDNPGTRPTVQSLMGGN